MTDFSTNSNLPRGLGSWLGMGASAYKLMIAIGSLLTTIVLTVGKLVVGLLSGSLALVADALQGLIDIIVTGVTVIVVSLSDRGSDPAWTCGREKLEAFAALAEAVLLGVIAVFIWHLAALKLVHGTAPMQLEAWYLVSGGCGLCGSGRFHPPSDRQTGRARDRQHGAGRQCRAFPDRFHGHCAGHAGADRGVVWFACG